MSKQEPKQKDTAPAPAPFASQVNSVEELRQMAIGEWRQNMKMVDPKYGGAPCQIKRPSEGIAVSRISDQHCISPGHRHSPLAFTLPALHS